jgi:hypothetical protein
LRNEAAPALLSEGASEVEHDIFARMEWRLSIKGSGQSDRKNAVFSAWNGEVLLSLERHLFD